jgi:hypothetical protein
VRAGSDRRGDRDLILGKTGSAGELDLFVEVGLLVEIASPAICRGDPVQAAQLAQWVRVRRSPRPARRSSTRRRA